MTREEYEAAIAEYKSSNRLEHGGKWEKHKYIRIENGRYIYPGDEKKSSSVGQKIPVALGGRLTNPEYESHRDRTDSYQTTESYQEEAKKVAAAKAAGRTATQQYQTQNSNTKTTAANSGVTKEKPKGDIRDVFKDKSVPSASLETTKKLADYQGHHDRKSVDEEKIYKKAAPKLNDTIAKFSKDLEDSVYNSLKDIKSKEDMDKFMSDGNDSIKKITDNMEALYLMAWNKDTSRDEQKAVESAIEASMLEAIMKAFSRAQKDGVHIPNVSEYGAEINEYMKEKSRAVITDNKKVDPRHFKHGFDSRDDFYAAVYDYKKAHKVEHHGILGQKWGIRRYQNPDGTLTEVGKKRYNADAQENLGKEKDDRERRRNEILTAKGAQKRLNDLDQAMAFHKRDAADAEREQAKHERKADKALEKGKYEKYEKESQKAKAFYEKAMKSYDQLNKGYEEVNGILNKLDSHGAFNIKVSSINRNANRMKDTLKGLAVSTLLGPQNIVYYQHYVDGLDYEVSRKK